MNSWPTVQPGSVAFSDGSDAQDGFDGSILGGALTVVRAWFGRFVSVPDDLDLDLLALWAAHTHVALETYSTPRLILDSTMPGSGKTTVLEHLQRLSYAPIQAASISSPALLADPHRRSRPITRPEETRRRRPHSHSEQWVQAGRDQARSRASQGRRMGRSRDVHLCTRSNGR
jgi:hypothetical protein